MKHLFAGLLLAGATLTSAYADNPIVELHTSKGPITVELFEDKAPQTVANFLAYTNKGFYNGTVFHRVIPGFMIQGGGFNADMQQKNTDAPVKNEADNGLRNEVGTLAMARTQDPHSATAQFFINVADNAFLDHRSPAPRGWGYAVFGRVIEGMDVVNSITQVPTGNHGYHQNVPQEPIVIEKASVRTAAE